MGDMRMFIRFPDQSASFVHGYEAGGIEERLVREGGFDSRGGFPVHRANVAVIENIANARGFDIEWIELDHEDAEVRETWINVALTPAKRGLRVVQGDRDD